MATAHQYFPRCAEVAGQNGFGGIEVVNGSMVGFTGIYLNQLSEAVEIGLNTVSAANKVGHQRAEMLNEILVAQALYVMADYAGARQHNTKVIEFARQLGSPRFDAQGLLYEGKLDRAENRPGDAVKTLETALAMSEKVGHGFSGRVLWARSPFASTSRTQYSVP